MANDPPAPPADDASGSPLNDSAFRQTANDLVPKRTRHSLALSLISSLLWTLPDILNTSLSLGITFFRTDISSMRLEASRISFMGLSWVTIMFFRLSRASLYSNLPLSQNRYL